MNGWFGSSAAVVLVIAVCSLAMARPEPPAAAAQAGLSFRHTKHVPQAWYDGRVEEQWRDCRACHDFSAETAEAGSNPYPLCAECHVVGPRDGGVFRALPKPGFEKGLARLRGPDGTDRVFSHQEHEPVACRECHLPQAGDDDAHLPIRTGAASCERCHADVPEQDVPEQIEGVYGLPEPRRDAAYLRGVFGEGGAMNEGARLRPRAIDVGPFRHADHLTPEQLAADDAASCDDCHLPLKTTGRGASAGMGAIRSEACTKCHHQTVDEDPFERLVAEEVRPSPSAGSFGHDEHYRFTTTDAARRDPAIADEAGYAAIAQVGCNHCHTYQGADSVAGDDYRYRDLDGHPAHDYAGCLTCHALPAAQTGERPWQTRDGLHRSERATAEDPLAEWASCAECHQFGEPDFGENRATVEVDRLDPDRFRIATQRHPYIVDGDGNRSLPDPGDCIDCHKYSQDRLRGLPSRIGERPFRHTSHLGTAPKAESCRECHAQAWEAKSSTELGQKREGEDCAQTFSSGQTCTECHQGAEIEAVALDGDPCRRRLRVVEFSHADHMTTTALVDGERVDCMDCHMVREEAVAGEADLVTLVDALDCTKCHGHAEADDVARSGALGDAHARACATCHLDRIPAVEPRDGDPQHRPLVEVFAGFRGERGQFHPRCDRPADCRECHRNGALHQVPTTGPDATYHCGVKGRIGEVHAGSPPPFSRAADKDGCVRCHWKNVSGAPDVEAAGYRNRAGNDRENYPGPKSRSY